MTRRGKLTWPSAGSFVVQLMEALEDVMFVTETAEMTGGVLSGGLAAADRQVNVAWVDRLRPAPLAE